jgi:hypothetical protein
MTRIETVLSQFFNPGDSTQQPQRSTHLIIPMEQHDEVDTAAEVTQVLAHWIRVDLTFAVLWFSTEDLGFVILTPTEIVLHRVGPPISLP